MKIKLLSFVSLISASSVFSAAALSGGVSGVGTVQSAIPLEYKTLEVDLATSYYPGSQLSFENSGTSSETKAAGADRFDLISSVNYGLFPFLEVGILYPYYRDMDQNGKEYKGLGDIRTSFKLNYPPYAHKKGFEVSLLAQVEWPTATSAGQHGGYTRHVWNTKSTEESVAQTKNAFGADGPVLITQMLTTANFGAIEGFIPLKLHLNWGTAFSGASSQNAFLLGGGSDVSPNQYISLFWSFQTEVPITQASKDIPLFSFPFSSAAGLQFNMPQNLAHLYAGVHFDMNDRPGTTYSSGESAQASPNYARVPAFGFFGGVTGSVAFVPRDQDHDGIFGENDRCPSEPEDLDGFEDDDGCPDLDNDKDRIPDLKDKCIDQAEDQDGFEDDDGCPDLDNDQDHILDRLDKCKNDAEDLDGFQDDDGCPDPDNDQDKVLDAEDRCPMQAEDQDGFEDQDGCPDPDNDRDGIPDALDRCPMQAEIVNGIDDGDGCPDSAPAVTQPSDSTPTSAIKPKPAPMPVAPGVTPAR